MPPRRNIGLGRFQFLVITLVSIQWNGHWGLRCSRQSEGKELTVGITTCKDRHWSTLHQAFHVTSQSLTYVQLQTLQIQWLTSSGSQNCNDSVASNVSVRVSLYNGSSMDTFESCTPLEVGSNASCSQSENQTVRLHLDSLPIIGISGVSPLNSHTHQNYTLCFSVTTSITSSLNTFCTASLHPPEDTPACNQTVMNSSDVYRSELVLTLQRKVLNSHQSSVVAFNPSHTGCCIHCLNRGNTTSPRDDSSNNQTADVIMSCLGAIVGIVFLLIAAWRFHHFWQRFIEESKQRAKAQSVLRKASQHFELRALQLQTFGYSASAIISPNEERVPTPGEQSAHPTEVDDISLIPPLLEANLFCDFQRQGSCYSFSREGTPMSASQPEDIVDGRSESSTRENVHTNEIALVFEEGPRSDTLSLHEMIVM